LTAAAIASSRILRGTRFRWEDGPFFPVQGRALMPVQLSQALSSVIFPTIIKSHRNNQYEKADTPNPRTATKKHPEG
jgi:hypothetical protein